MHHSRLLKSTSLSLLLITAIYVVASACQDLTAPCAQDEAKRESRGLLDKRWRVTTINGQPAQGFPIPGRTETFYSGIIEFQTTEAETEGGNCEDIFRSKGEAVAIYALRQSSGNLSGSERYVSRFTYFHKDYTVSFTAGNQTVEGTVSGRTMTLVAPQFGNATMVLTRD
jgi:hypothetical protein